MLGPLAGLWYSTPRNPLCRSLILDLSSFLSLAWISCCFWLPLSIFSIPSWSLQPSLRCPILSTVVPAPSWSLPHGQSPLCVGSFHSGNVRVSCIPTPVWFLYSDSYLLLAPVFYSCLALHGPRLPLLPSAASLFLGSRLLFLASAVWLSASASDFSFCLPLLGSRLPHLASAVGLPASASDFSFCLLLLGSRLPLLAAGF